MRFYSFNRAIFYFLLVFGWWAITNFGRIDPFFLPDPINVFTDLINGILYEDYIYHVIQSLIRVFLAFTIASIFGIVTSLVFTSSKLFDDFIHPINSFFRYIPASAFLGLIVLWFGIEQLEKIFLIFLGLIFYIVQMSYDSVIVTYRNYFEFCNIYQINGLRRVWYVLITGSLPGIIDTLRINYTASWIFLIIAEYVGGEYGIGFMITRSQRYLNTEQLFSVLVLLGLIGCFSDFLFQKLKRIICKWLYVN